MHPKAEALQARTRAFLRQVIRFVEALPQSAAAQRIKVQLLDSAGSVDSNYRGACRGRSRREFIAKLGVAAEEADESKGWLMALVDNRLCDVDTAAGLIQEADELTAIFVASQKTAKRNERSKKGRRPPVT